MYQQQLLFQMAIELHQRVYLVTDNLGHIIYKVGYAKFSGIIIVIINNWASHKVPRPRFVLQTHSGISVFMYNFAWRIWWWRGGIIKEPLTYNLYIYILHPIDLKPPWSHNQFCIDHEMSLPLWLINTCDHWYLK